jgi:methyl-accepting chemotaxis protein
VKSLATQTAKATEDITGQIAAIQSSTEQAVVAIEAVGRVIGQVHEIATGIAAAVEEQGAATGEIARNVQEASQNTQAMSGNVAGVSTAVAESHAVADRVRTVAQSVGGHSDELRGELDAFLAKVKAV